MLRHKDGSKDSIKVNHSYNAGQIEWFKAGSALNLMAKQIAASSKGKAAPKKKAKANTIKASKKTATKKKAKKPVKKKVAKKKAKKKK